MKVILGHRQTGKTVKLIRMSAKTNTYIVASSQQEASRIFRKAKELGLNIPLPITFNEFISHGYYGKGINGFLIDNADYLLRSLSTVPILAVSMTKEV